MIVDELIALLGYRIEGEGELRRFQQSIDQTAKRITLFAAAAATAAAGAMVFLGKSVIETSAKFESYAATLETIEGSAEKAQKALDWVTNFGAKTPYEVGEVTEAFVRLKSYGIDPTTGALESVGDASSAMGKTLMQGVEAIADAATGEFERLKEFGITSSVAGDKVTFNWTKNSKTLSKTVKKNSAEIIQFLKDNFADRFNGAMLRQSKTWTGMVSNLGDAWTGFLRKVGDAGFFDAVKRQLGRLLDFMGELSSNGTLDRFAKALGLALEKGVNAAVFLVDRLRRHFEFLSNWVSVNPALFKAIATGLGLIAAVKFPFLSGILVLEEVLSWMEGGDTIIGRFADALSKLTGIDAEKLGYILATLAGAAGLAATATAITGLTAALNPLVLSLAAFAGAFWLAKSGIEALGFAKTALDDKIAATTAVDNPKSKPGYVEGMGGIYMKGSAVVDQPRPPDLMEQMTPDALDLKLRLQNLEGNLANQRANGSAATVAGPVNDNRNQSTTVNVGGVTVNGVQNAGPATGAAVGNAVGRGAARASRFEKDDSF